MKFVVLTKSGKVMCFSVLNCAKLYVEAYDGVMLYTETEIIDTETVGV